MVVLAAQLTLQTAKQTRHFVGLREGLSALEQLPETGCAGSLARDAACVQFACAVRLRAEAG